MHGAKNGHADAVVVEARLHGAVWVGAHHWVDIHHTQTFVHSTKHRRGAAFDIEFWLQCAV